MGLIEYFQRKNKNPDYQAPSERSSNLAAVIPPKSGSKIQLAWPLKNVSLTSTFGHRGRNFHEGIDLKAKTGTPVFAAQSGRVIYAGSSISGYGKMVVIKHNDEFSTIYAHNSRLHVRSGEIVQLGMHIADSGNTGSSFGPHVHFEVRRGIAALDPMKYLPNFRTQQRRPIQVALKKR